MANNNFRPDFLYDNLMIEANINHAVTGITGQDGAYLAELPLSKGYIVHGAKQWWAWIINRRSNLAITLYSTIEKTISQ